MREKAEITSRSEQLSDFNQRRNLEQFLRTGFFLKEVKFIHKHGIPESFMQPDYLSFERTISLFPLRTMLVFSMV